MVPIRIVRATLCVLGVMLPLVGGLLPVAGAADEMTVDRALRRVLRTHLPLSGRLAAAAVALEDRESADGETLARAGLALLPEAPSVATWLLLAGTEAAWLDEDLRSRGRSRVDALLAAPGEDAARASWTAAGLLLGHRPAGFEDALVAAWPPDAATAAVLRRAGADPTGPAAATRATLARRAPAARALEKATSAEVETMREGLDALLDLGDAALPLLLHELRTVAGGVPPGRLPRTMRSILALGLLGRREATPALVACLDSPNGWVKVSAATALGDLGDPAAAIALCYQLMYRGDVLRPLDQWDWPGKRATTVSQADWSSAEYYVVDGAAADALLRLGAPGAVAWILRNQLDPSKSNFRVRVLQDGIDALRRAVPDAPVDAYNPDTGFPQRRAAFEALLAWWTGRRFDDGDLLDVKFDAADPGFRREARRMVERLRGRSIMELQISQETCALLGRAVTPTLLETLAVAKSRVLRTEIARALGAVRDVEAVPVLLALMHDDASFLRAVATTSAGSYLGRDPRVERALIERLDDPEAAPRVAALKALVAAPPSDGMRAALERHTPETHAKRFGAEDRDFHMAWTIARLVQAGPGDWPSVREGLGHPERYVRRTWWDLLRRALALPNSWYDANLDPSDPSWERVDEPRILEALRARRAR